MRTAARRLADTAIGVILLALGILAPLAVVQAADSTAVARTTTTPGIVAEGKRLFLAVGCYECHGTTGTGASTTGPRLAPNPVPAAAFVYQLRNPIGKPPYGNMQMPAYGETVLNDSQVADI